VRSGNVVRPLVDGVPAFRRICEAVAAARRRVWATIAFVDHTVELPDRHGTLFDVLDRAVARGLDVRVVFWREPELDPAPPGWEHFPGNAAERAWLRERSSAFLARWDHQPRGCHHQKSWIVDAGEASETAFVGGINLDRMSVVDRGHREPTPLEHYHDVYVDLRGPAATDVHHNFVQRWNGATERSREDGTWPAAADDLPYPSLVTRPCGSSDVQIARTIRAGSYDDLPAGEQSVLEQYLGAIDAATDAIYVENQFFGYAPGFAALERALARGVEVIAVVPKAPLREVKEARAHPRSAELYAQLAALGRHERFTLAGLVAMDGPGRYRDVYVHAKMAIVDDAWVTIGSANFERRSFERHTELNATCWDARVAGALRRDLFAEHLGTDDELSTRDAMARFREAARANAERLRRGEPLEGLPVALDAAHYGE
jgi:cardiolipin synthase A/B